MSKSGPKTEISDDEFITLYPKLGATKLSKKLGLKPTSVFGRRQRLEQKYKISIEGIDMERPRMKPHPYRIHLDVRNGHVLVGSDAHIWPGDLTTGMRGFIEFAKELKPKAVILNGDVMDFSQISRHDPLGWGKVPAVKEEIEAAQEILHKIAKAAGRVDKIWTFGNHDARFERYLSLHAEKYEGLIGMHLKDHFPLWRPCWSTWINDNTVVKHRYKSGVHAPWNNVMNAGLNIITAHLHSAKVMPFTSYRGTLYGVDDGCLCDPEHAAFLYQEDSPKNWRQGFCVLSFRDGRLLQPQLALVHDEDHIDYCGSLYPV